MNDVVDTHAVCGVCLRDLLRPLVNQEFLRRDQPLDGSRSNRSNSTGALDVLARESQVNLRRIWGIMNCEHATIGLRVADQLLSALDRPDLVQLLTVFRRKRGRRLGIAGNHVGCSLAEETAAACRLASVEPVLTARAPDCGGDVDKEREAA